MTQHTISLTLPEPTLAALTRIATTEGVSVDTIVRDAISVDIFHRDRFKTPMRGDERLVFVLQARLAGVFAAARNWGDLLSRLRAKGYRLALSGSGLVLTDLSGHRLCTGSDIGQSHAALQRRFGAPFPNHNHEWQILRARQEGMHDQTPFRAAG